MKLLLSLLILLSGDVVAQSITVTNSFGSKLVWDDSNPLGSIRNYVATMTSPMGTFTASSTTNSVFLTNFTSAVFVDGNYSFSVSAIKTNNLASTSTNLNAFILVPPMVTINLRLTP